MRWYVDIEPEIIISPFYSYDNFVKQNCEQIKLLNFYQKNPSNRGGTITLSKLECCDFLF